MRRKAVSYLRVSTKEQGDYGFSLPTQDLDNRAYAARNSIDIIDTVQEDISGLILERAGLSKVRSMLREGIVDTIISHDSDRISREPTHYSILRDEWQKLGVELHYALRGRINLDDFGDQLKEDMYGRFAYQWYKKIVENTHRGKRGKVISGKVTVAKRPPYGYRLESDTLIVYEPEAEIVRLIFSLYTIEKLSLSSLAKYLGEQGIPSPGDDKNYHKIRGRAVWSQMQLRRILRRETYLGTWYWGKSKKIAIIVAGREIMREIKAPREMWIGVEVPAIIDQPTFDAAQILLRTNKQNSPRNTKYEYLLAKRLTCGKCGCRVYGLTQRYNDKVFSYYHCGSKDKNHTAPNCGAPYFRAIDVDNAVWAWLEGVLKDPEKFDQLLKASLQERMAEQPFLILDLEKVQEEIVKKETSLKRLIRTFADGDIDRDALSQVSAEIKEELESLRVQEAELLAGLADIPNINQDLVHANLYRQLEATFNFNGEPPFEVKSAFIEALNVQGVLEELDSNRQMRIMCDIGEETLQITERSGRKPLYILQIKYTLPLPNYKHRDA